MARKRRTKAEILALAPEGSEAQKIEFLRKEVTDGYMKAFEESHRLLNPQKTVENLLNFCNLPWEDNCINIEKNNRPIFTASVSQARNKINTKSIESWKKFQQYLPELFIEN